MHILHYLVAFAFITRVCGGAVSFEPKEEDHSLDVAARDGSSSTAETIELPSNSLALRSSDSSLATVSWTFGGNKVLNFGVFIVNSFVVGAVCAASGGISCGIAAAYAVFTSFFAKWAFSSRSTDFDVSDLGADSEITELEPGTWHTIGHMRVGIFNHSLHYYNHGSNIHSLRAWQRNIVSNGTEGSDKRAESDNDGTVIDYNWQSTNEQSYNDFGSSSSSTSYFAANSMGYMIDTAQGVAACADFADQDGDMDEAVLTIGWNNQAFDWDEPGEFEAALSSCNGK
ncbi:hypothetical protein EW026_g7341 [Hermanssonia centrifuga]|uniref:Uncharacterized protein n=1 Tax=Hermanssonia centrifuga TaxID=98765 RepID=A0A4S4K852_9APHY|nr:hypothetical protein EW026_g7341 [Hermanssonia centrifuga]